MVEFIIILIIILIFVAGIVRIVKVVKMGEQYLATVKRYNEKQASYHASAAAKTTPSAGARMAANQYAKKAASVPAKASTGNKSHKQPEKNTGQEQSTTAYLQKKARQDRIAHAKEKFEENKRISQKYGGRAVGGRYLPGDPIPRGMRIAFCPYCGAENIVESGYQGGRDCYFCRTQLK